MSTSRSPNPSVRPAIGSARSLPRGVFLGGLLLAGTVIWTGCGAPEPPRAGPPQAEDEARPAPVSAPAEEIGLSPATVGEPAPDAPKAPAESVASPDPTGLVVDRERGEVRFPCTFVNPTRILEVFACHTSGPTHETVVEFAATGQDIYRALRSIGLRSARYWNGTSPTDFLQNQGDKVLVLVRWEHGGQTHEHPAETMLLDGPSGFPAFLRGFSVSTRGLLPEERREEDSTKLERLPGEDPATLSPEIPTAVEITLGASNRQSPSFSLLTHPTNLPRLVSWVLPPELDASAVPQHAELVAKQVPATLIIRKLASEEALIDEAQRIARLRGQSDRVSLYDRIRPIAKEIDELKAQYQALLGEIRELLGGGLDVSGLTEEEKAARAEEGLALLRKGRWLCARIEERYLTQYAMEEDSKARWAESQEGLNPEVRDEAIVLARDGVAFEPKLAAKRVEAAAIELRAGELPPAERRIRSEIVAKEAELIEIERKLQLARANTRGIERRLQALDPTEDYLRRLLEEDLEHFTNTQAALDAQGRIATTELRELRGLLEGTWEAARDATLAERERAKRDKEIAELKDQLVQLRAQIRWAENDLGSGVSDRVEGAKAELEEARAKQDAIERRIAELIGTDD